MVLIYDSHINHKDVELFLCLTNRSDSKWFKADYIGKDVLEIYKSKAMSENQLIKTCNTDKSKIFACNMKCKTRGILLGCSPCGIILGFRELYGSESCSQVAQMYLDLCMAYRCNYKLYSLIT